MTQDTYRFAYEEANAELQEILAQFERLSQRKAQMEQIVEALRPLLSDAPAAAIADEVRAPEATPFLVQSAPEPAQPAEEAAPEPAVAAFTAEPEAELVAESSDPFQRRIDNALRQGFGSRETRVLSLGMNGLLTRA